MKVIILDRDGVINYDSPDYIKSPEEWHPLPGSIEAIALLSKAGYRIYVATNQAGLARGLFDQDMLMQIHKKMIALVNQAEGEIAGIFYCPHHPDEHCRCRKPGIGLLEQISEHSKHSLKGVPFVGDSLKDMQAAHAMGCKGVLVETGNGQSTKLKVNEELEIFPKLLDFAESYLR
ncbi:MAG: D-glycero-beta-D-manno-heptose 1,7-bisphosphate 7-phosphatase [Pseudomonadales bacterium]|nr:D-glycero-beta-D-manno-heptose 1,7-bisphosphate 7-phosphatase [Pseudomonadales bacterium]